MFAIIGYNQMLRIQICGVSRENVPSVSKLLFEKNKFKVWVSKFKVWVACVIFVPCSTEITQRGKKQDSAPPKKSRGRPRSGTNK